MSYQKHKPYVNDSIFRDDVGSFVDPNKQQKIAIQGQTGFGKSLTGEKIVEELHDVGWTVFDAWASDNLENLFWCVNLDCRKEHEQWRLKNPTAKEPLHCNCHKRSPIMVLLPDYFDVLNLEKYNVEEVGKQEWIAYQKKMGETIIEWDPKIPHYIPKQWVKIKKLPRPSRTPRSTQNEEIVNRFTEALLECRAEGRYLVFNPHLFPIEFDKFQTLALIFRALGKIVFQHFRKLREQDDGIPWEKRTDKQKCHHRLVVLARELGELTAAVLKGEDESTSTKKAILNFIRKSRHYNVSTVFDFQRPEDVFSGIRDQADIFILKRAPRRLFGEEWTWAFDRIEYDRKKIFEKQGYNVKTFTKVNEQHPKVEELNYNRMYVVYSNDKMKLWKMDSPNSHHKRPDDNFEDITGIKFVIPESMKEVIESSKSSGDKEKGKKETSSKKVEREMVFSKLDHIITTEHVTTKEAAQKLADLADQELIPKIYDYRTMDWKVLNNAYNRWKKAKGFNKK